MNEKIPLNIWYSFKIDYQMSAAVSTKELFELSGFIAIYPKMFETFREIERW